MRLKTVIENSELQLTRQRIINIKYLDQFHRYIRRLSKQPSAVASRWALASSVKLYYTRLH